MGRVVLENDRSFYGLNGFRCNNLMDWDDNLKRFSWRDQNWWTSRPGNRLGGCWYIGIPWVGKDIIDGKEGKNGGIGLGRAKGGIEGMGKKKSPPWPSGGDTLLTKNIQNQLNQIFAIRLTDEASNSRVKDEEQKCSSTHTPKNFKQRTRYNYP